MPVAEYRMVVTRFRIPVALFRMVVDFSVYEYVFYRTVPADLMGAFQLIPYSSAEDAVFKALGVE